jgi:hypothetical protein
VSGRVIIDTEAFDRFNPDKLEDFNDLKDEDFTIIEVPELSERTANRLKSDYSLVQVSPKIKLTEEAHLICKEVVSGYSLKLKKWCK